MESTTSRRVRLDRIVLMDRIKELHALIKKFARQRDSFSQGLRAGWRRELAAKRRLVNDLHSGAAISRRDIEWRAPVPTLSGGVGRERRG